MAKKKQEQKQNTNAWITTYTDLMTLLLTFFVLLISISVMDSRKQRDALNSLVGAFGFKPGGHSVIGVKKGINITVGSAPLDKEQVDFEHLKNITFRNGLESDVEVTTEGEKIVIGLSNRVLFKPREYRITQKGENFLLQVCPVLKDVPGTVELRGYTDPSEVLFDDNKSKAAVILSARRAMAVYNFLVQRCRLPARKLVAHGFGIKELKQGEIKGSMRFNRQVEIICDYRASIPYLVKKGPRKKNLFLDFKGFFFKIRQD